MASTTEIVVAMSEMPIEFRSALVNRSVSNTVR